MLKLGGGALTGCMVDRHRIGPATQLMIIFGLFLALDRGVTGHSERYNNINLVALLFLRFSNRAGS